ncbi:GntR family transcriptional regulator [Variovorax sp. LjRoot290]|uniref:GntR family transcriptional regulator n=1 Tax=unclassified Variovorax TaxID=663243 RepID=UPI000882356C|nr:GntR family transcriptional regulator [Variovorax sp. CF079]SDE59014.1 DNA-binding transcriptional regulator, GntR family [Variovorax sp. CF079]
MISLTKTSPTVGASSASDAESDLEALEPSLTAAVSDTADGVDLAGDAYRILLEMIQLGRLPMDKPLQERTLAATLGISRTPLREAMSRLIGGGFAIRTPRGQLMVREPTLRQYLQILQIRVLLEGETAAAAATRLDVQQAKQILAQVQALLVARNTSKEENHRIDNLVHDTIAMASGNPLMAQTVHDLRIKARCFDQNAAPERFAPSCQEHMAILQAIIDRDPDQARAAMQQHLENARTGHVARHTSI